MNIPDEAVEAAKARFIACEAVDLMTGHKDDIDADFIECWESDLDAALTAALTAALPYIMEGVAREYDRKAEAHAAECHHREAAGERVRMGEFAKAGKIRGIADDLRSLAPMEKTPIA